MFKATTNGDVGSAIRFFYLSYRFSQLDLRLPTGQLRRPHLLQQLLDGRNRRHRFQLTFHSIKSGSGLPPSGGQRLTGNDQTLLRLLQSQTAIGQFNLNWCLFDTSLNAELNLRPNSAENLLCKLNQALIDCYQRLSLQNVDEGQPRFGQRIKTLAFILPTRQSGRQLGYCLSAKSLPAQFDWALQLNSCFYFTERFQFGF